MADVKFTHPRLAAVYDAMEHERDDLDVYERLVVDELGATSVLDVGCGTGSLAVRLARRGLDVVGVDPAAASVEVARSKPDADRVRWVVGTAPDVPPLQPDLSRSPGTVPEPGQTPVVEAGGPASSSGSAGSSSPPAPSDAGPSGPIAPFDVATMTGNVAQVFLTDEQWLATLRAVRAALRPGGVLVFEARRPEARAWEGWTTEQTRQVVEVPGLGRVESWGQVTAVEGERVTFESPTLFHADGTRLESTSTLWFRPRAAIEASLAEAGLELLDVRDAPDRPGLEWVYLARRPVG